MEGGRREIDLEEQAVIVLLMEDTEFQREISVLYEPFRIIVQLQKEELESY